jgi:hypothetical protein
MALAQTLRLDNSGAVGVTAEPPLVLESFGGSRGGMGRRGEFHHGWMSASLRASLSTAAVETLYSAGKV